jgi:hypothetical protein
MNMSPGKIVIPYNEAGKRVYDVFYRVAEKLLARAREATQAFLSETLPNAEIIEEYAMTNGKYELILAFPGGERQKITYDYRTKIICQFDEPTICPAKSGRAA